MKLKQKIDLVMWAIIALLPVFAYFVVNYRMTTEWLDFISFVDSFFCCTFVAGILDNVWVTAFGESLVIAPYLGYLITVEIAHCLFDVVVFIPRFAHSLIERSEGLCSRK